MAKDVPVATATKSALVELRTGGMIAVWVGNARRDDKADCTYGVLSPTIEDVVAFPVIVLRRFIVE